MAPPLGFVEVVADAVVLTVAEGDFTDFAAAADDDDVSFLDFLE
jgi:hypothetical protein